MEMEARTIPLPEQPSHNVIRPVDDLWLWWTLASIIGYLIFEIPSKLLGKSFVETIVSFLTTFVSVILLIWVLNRYLSNFNWKRWIIVNVIGAIFGAFALVFGLLAVLVIGNLVSHAIVGNNSMDRLVFIVVTCVTTSLTVGLIIAVAQWRVLGAYARGYGRNLWVKVNVISTFIGVLPYGITSYLTDNVYVQLISGIIASAVATVIVGYTLMQILRPYAPASTR